MAGPTYPFDPGKTKLGYGAIDIVVNLYTPDVIAEIGLPTDENFRDKVRVAQDHRRGLTLEQYIDKMDRAGIERCVLSLAGPGVQAERDVKTARDKARAVEGELVLAADTIVAVGGEILGKPRDDADAARAVRLAGGEAVALWHADADLQGVDAVVLPGGFSYGDYLRCGAISRFAPVMTEVVGWAGRGMPVLGICNGFQILCEAHLLPGALIRNDVRVFVCKDQDLRVESVDTTWTSGFTAGQVIRLVLKNGEGGYVADEETLRRVTRTMALEKVAQPEDVAAQVVVLASDVLSGHVTGQVVTVAGGMEGRVLH